MLCLRFSSLHKGSRILATFLVLAPISSLAQDAPQDSEKALRSSPRRSLSQEEQESLVQKIWWNQEDLMTSLKLDEDQRGRMDEALRVFLGAQEERREAVRGAQSEFSRLLEKNELENAREAALRIGEATGAAAQTQADLKVDVLSMMTTTQRSQLISDYAHLLRQPWIRLNMQIGRQGERGAVRSRQRKKEDG